MQVGHEDRARADHDVIDDHADQVLADRVSTSMACAIATRAHARPWRRQSWLPSSADASTMPANPPVAPSTGGVVEAAATALFISSTAPVSRRCVDASGRVVKGVSVMGGFRGWRSTRLCLGDRDK